MRTFILVLIVCIDAQYDVINLSTQSIGEQIILGVAISIGSMFAIAQDVKELVRE